MNVRAPEQYEMRDANVRILDFSNATGMGDWSADILVRLCVMVNPKAHPKADRRTRMSALQNNMRCAMRTVVSKCLA